MGVFTPGTLAKARGSGRSALAARLAGAIAAEHERWILWLPVLIGAGIGLYFALPVEPTPWLGLVVFTCIAGLCLVLRGSAASVLYLGLIMIGAVAAGFAAAQVRTVLVAAPVVEERVGPMPIVGRIVKAERLGKGRRVTLDQIEADRLLPEETPARVRLRLNGKQPELAPGDRVRVYAVLSPPSPPTAPGAFDFQRQAFFARLGATGFGIGKAEVLTSDQQQLDIWLSRLRARIEAVIHSHVGAPEASLVSGLLTGEQAAIPAPLLQAIRDSGLAHLLAISGMNIGLVAVFLFSAVRFAFCLVPGIALGWPVKKIAAVIAVLGAGAYTLIAAAPIPTQRAFIMVAVVFLGVIADRKALSMRLVAVAASAVLVAQPESLLGASFQLSFAAVVALVAAYETEQQERLRRLGDGLLARSVIYILFVAVTTVIATAATTPYAIFHFQRVAIYGLPANLVAVPITALWIMPLGVGALLAMPFGLAGPFLIGMGWGAHIIMRVAEAVAAWPAAVAPVPALPVAGLVAVTLGGLWLCLWRGRWRYGGIVLAAAGMGSLAAPAPPDILIDGSARLIGVRTADGRLAFSPTRAAKFERASWLQHSGLREASAWPEGVGEEVMRCDGTGCVLEVNGRMVALMHRPDGVEDDCRRADVIVSLVPLRGACPHPVAVVDRFDLWRDGAHAIWLEPDAVRVLSVNGLRGDRPWVLRPKPRDHPTKEGRTIQAPG